MPEAPTWSPKSRPTRRSREAGSSASDQSVKHEHGSHQSVDASSQPTKKKQKRNKPTLSCSQCVERKTKCDRGRPACLSCVKRGSECQYTAIANLIVSTSDGGSRPNKTKKLARPSISSITTELSAVGSPGQLPTPVSYKRSGSTSSSHSSPFLLSHVPHSRQPSASVFGISSEHPFANYWTTAGGMPEVIGVLPSKDHADLLVAKYFEAIDPVYPMLNRQRFYAEYHRFWGMQPEGKNKSDASLLALHFAVYAMGAQFIQMESEQQKAQIAEFYVSAAHQSLRLYPFLSRTSLNSIQAMVLIKYFLMNDNKAADAWAFGGILIEQAYAMGLNRDPDLIVPHMSAMEKHLRRKLWQAVYFQDTFLTILLKLPPTTTVSDVTVDSLTEEPIDPTLPIASALPLSEPLPIPAVSTNPMSISNIAPQQTTQTTLGPPLPFPPASVSSQNDIAFVRSMWKLADLVQQTICVPRALSRPLTQSPKQKAELLAAFRSLYASFPPNLTNTSRADFRLIAAADPRQARQNLFLRSNYWHCVMLIEADENEAAGVRCDARGALEAGSLAVNAFFDFWDNLRVDAGVWWVFQHRAFEEALTMANLLSAVQFPPSATAANPTEVPIEQVFRDAKDNCCAALNLLELVGSSAPEMQKTRTEVLRAAFECIAW